MVFIFDIQGVINLTFFSQTKQLNGFQINRTTQYAHIDIEIPQGTVNWINGCINIYTIKKKSDAFMHFSLFKYNPHLIFYQ